MANLFADSDPKEAPYLLDGQRYWLGATWGRYDAENDVFLLGNCFVRRFETVYSEHEVIEEK